MLFMNIKGEKGKQKLLYIFQTCANIPFKEIKSIKENLFL